MSEIVRENMTDVSIYVKGLDNDARARYFRKLEYEKGTRNLPDPYKVPRGKWQSDPCLWPELQFGQLYVYLIETPALFSHSAMKNFKSLEAYRYVVSGHVQEVLYHDVPDSPFGFLKTGVLPSMKTNDRPHEAWVCLGKYTADVFCAHCTCMAGLGETCSHVAAVLYKIHLAVQSGITKKSVTSEACAWNKVFKTEVQPSTIEDLQHLMNNNRKKKVESIVSSGQDPLPSQDVLESLYRVCPDASFFTLIPPMNQDQVDRMDINMNCVKDPKLPPLLTGLYDERNLTLSENEISTTSTNVLQAVSCSPEQIENLFKKTQTQNISALWYQHRKGRVTGTKAHDILVRRVTTAPENLVMRVLDYKSYDLSKKEAVRWGLDMEAEVRTIYTKHYTDQHVNFHCKLSGFLISASDPFFGATADGVICCSCCGIGTLEIKCPFKHKNVNVQEAAATDNEFCLNQDMTLKKRHRYYTQIQFQMMVFDVKYCDFVVCTMPKGEPSIVIIRVVRDQVFIDTLTRKCREFVEQYVIPELLTCRLKTKVKSSSVPDKLMR